MGRRSMNFMLEQPLDKLQQSSASATTDIVRDQRFDTKLGLSVYLQSVCLYLSRVHCCNYGYSNTNSDDSSKLKCQSKQNTNNSSTVK
jgi:hypothetical protein